MLAGRALFEKIEKVVRRAVVNSDPSDLDFLCYLWSGPHSPLFGKDRIATLERDFIADKSTHHEVKDSYFSLIHEVEFLRQGLDGVRYEHRGRIDCQWSCACPGGSGESPLKRSGKAITIAGAFSEAYGDYGYTLLLEPDRIVLAEHSHFDSVESAIQQGVDIIPKVQSIRAFESPRRTSRHRTWQANCLPHRDARTVDRSLPNQSIT